MNQNKECFKRCKEKIMTNLEARKVSYQENPEVRRLTNLLVLSGAANLLTAFHYLAENAYPCEEYRPSRRTGGMIASLAAGGEFLLKVCLGFGMIALLAEVIDKFSSEDEKTEADTVSDQATAEPDEVLVICQVKETDDDTKVATTADTLPVIETQPQVVEEPVAETPVVEEVVAEEPVEETPVAEEVVAEEPVEETPVAEEVVAEEPVEETPVAEEVVAEEPVEETPVAEEAVAEEPVEETPVAEEAVEAVAMVKTATDEDSDEEDTNGFLASLGGYQPTYIDVVEQPEEYQKMLEQEKNGEVQLVTKYRKGFAARLIQSQGEVQEYYSAMKNQLLDYKGVKGRVSWTFDSYHTGRDRIAKINVKNKTIYLYLALDPKEMEDTKYGTVDMSGKKKFEEEPVLLKIKGNRKFKYALELIDKVCGEKLQLKKMGKEPVDYTVPYQETEDLVADGTVKKLVAAIPVSLIPKMEQ